MILYLESINFINTKDLLLIENVNMNKLIVPDKVIFGKRSFQYFIVCKDDRKVRPLCIILSKMAAYRRDFDATKYLWLFDKRRGIKLATLSKMDLIVKKYRIKNN